MSDLENLVEQLTGLELRVGAIPRLTALVEANENADYVRLVTEAKSIIDHELGPLNAFSSQLLMPMTVRNPSLADVMNVKAVAQGAANEVARKRTRPTAPSAIARPPTYVHQTRISELLNSSRSRHDVKRLVRLLEELNIVHANQCHMATAMLVRAVADHVPPVFGLKNFGEVASNYAGGNSFKGSMQQLQNSLRHIADAHLHVQMRKSETVPTERQVDFRNDLDVLLGEVVRLLRDPS